MSPKPDAASTTIDGGAEPRSFEAAYRELQQVVAQLEDGGPAGLQLERAVRLFERGSQLVKACERFVNEAQLRVTRLAAESATPLSDPSAHQSSPRSDAPVDQ